MSQPQTLSKLVRRMVAKSGADSTDKSLRGLGAAAAIAIRRKTIRFKQREKIRFRAWEQTVGEAPEQIASFLEQEDFRLLLKRDVEISYEKHPRQEVIFCTSKQRLVSIVRNNRRILMENPLKPKADGSLLIESWARASSISKSYKKHLPTAKGQKQSKYMRGIDFESIEYKLFDSAVGVLANERQLFLYGYFDDDIGTLPNGQATQYVAMQCDRRPRPTGRGYFVEIHSYPYSKAEVQRDLAGAQKLENLLNDIPLCVADYRLT